MTDKEKYVIENYYITTCGRIFSNMKFKDKSKYSELKYYKDKDGYFNCTLVYSDLKPKKGNGRERQPFRVNRIVAIKHIGDYSVDKNICGHKDNVKTNNSVCNLYWTDVSENTQHGFDNKSYKNIPSIEVYEEDTNKKRIFPSMSSACRFYKIPIGSSSVIKRKLEYQKNNLKFRVIESECND